VERSKQRALRDCEEKNRYQISRKSTLALFLHLWKAMWVALWTEPHDAQVALATSARESLTLLEAQLPEGRKFFDGDAIGFLDIAASGVALWLGLFEEMAGVTLLPEETHLTLLRWAMEYAAEEAVPVSRCQCTGPALLRSCVAAVAWVLEKVGGNVGQK
jgi:glutathione S-transferase